MFQLFLIISFRCYFDDPIQPVPSGTIPCHASTLSTNVHFYLIRHSWQTLKHGEYWQSSHISCPCQYQSMEMLINSLLPNNAIQLTLYLCSHLATQQPQLLSFLFPSTVLKTVTYLLGSRKTEWSCNYPTRNKEISVISQISEVSGSCFSFICKFHLP